MHGIPDSGCWQQCSHRQVDVQPLGSDLGMPLILGVSFICLQYVLDLLKTLATQTYKACCGGVSCFGNSHTYSHTIHADSMFRNSQTFTIYMSEYVHLYVHILYICLNTCIHDSAVSNVLLQKYVSDSCQLCYHVTGVCRNFLGLLGRRGMWKSFVYLVREPSTYCGSDDTFNKTNK